MKPIFVNKNVGIVYENGDYFVVEFKLLFLKFFLRFRAVAIINFIQNGRETLKERQNKNSAENVIIFPKGREK